MNLNEIRYCRTCSGEHPLENFLVETKKCSDCKLRDKEHRKENPKPPVDKVRKIHKQVLKLTEEEKSKLKELM